MYSKKVNKNSYKDMFSFLKEHYRYFTMNSWNRVKSIANNVKVYNIKELDYDILEYLELDDYFSININIEDWEIGHNGYEVGFNGKSGGYLVLYNKGNSNSVLDDYIEFNDTYEDFKEDIKNNYGSLKNYKGELIRQVELVQDFDNLCDELIQVCLYLKNNYEIVDEEKTYTRTIECLKKKRGV